MPAGELEELFERYRERGDVEALARVFDESAPKLLSLARHLCPDAATAEDVVQATFLAAIEQRDRFDPARGDLVAWLVGILSNKARLASALRAREIDRERLQEREEPDPALDAELREFIASLESALARIPAKYREVLRGHLASGKKPEELARELGRAPGTVRVQLHRGLALLRRLLPASFAVGLGISVAPRGLAAIRGEVLEQASRAAAGSLAAPAIVGGVLMGSKKLIGTAAALVALLLAWHALRGEPAQRAEIDSGVAATAADPSTEVVDALVASQGAEGRDPVTVPESSFPAPDEPYGSLEIEVVRADGQPVADVELSCLSWRESQPFQRIVAVETDERGRAIVERIHEGKVAISIVMTTPFGGGSAEVRRGETTTARIEMPPGIEVRGRVVDAQGRGAGGAEVWLDPDAISLGLASSICVARTDADGRFALPSVPRSSILLATHASFGQAQPVKLEKLVAEGASSVDIELTLQGPSAAIRGRVRTAEGAAVAGSRVSLRCRKSEAGGARPPWLLVRTDASGAFDQEGLPPGTVDVLVLANGFAPAQESIELEVTTAAEVDFVLDIGVSVSGVVLDGQGAPVEGAVIEHLVSPNIDVALEELRTASTRSDAEGRYRLAELPAGPLTLRATESESHGSRTSTQTLDASSLRELEWNVRFGDGLVISGFARTPTGEPLREWTLQALPRFDTPGTVAGHAETDSDGWFRIRNLSDVEYMLTLKQPDRYTPALEHGPVRPPQEVDLVAEIAGERSSFVTGTVVDSDGAPLTRLDVGGFSRAANIGIGTHTDEQGAFRLGPLESGDHFVNLTLADGRSIELDVAALRAAETRDLGRIRAPRAARVRAVLRIRGGVALVEPQIGLNRLDECFGARWPLQRHPGLVGCKSAMRLRPLARLRLRRTTTSSRAGR